GTRRCAGAGGGGGFGAPGSQRGGGARRLARDQPAVPERAGLRLVGGPREQQEPSDDRRDPPGHHLDLGGRPLGRRPRGRGRGQALRAFRAGGRSRRGPARTPCEGERGGVATKEEHSAVCFVFARSAGQATFAGQTAACFVITLPTGLTALDDRRKKAQDRAHGWFLSRNAGATLREAWAFARASWERFRPRAADG